MDFLAIRKKARERAEAARARAEGAPGAPPAATAPPVAGPPSPVAPLPPPPAPGAQEARQAAPATPSPQPVAPVEEGDPLDAFFWHADEVAPPVPDLGGAAGAAPGASTGERLREYVTFLLGSEEYGLDIGLVREIVKPPPIAEVPRAPQHVLGVVTLRGEVVPVFDPRQRLSLPARPQGARSRIVVCASARGLAGLLVDAVSHVVRLPAAAVEPRPPGLGAGGGEAIVGIGREGSRLVILLDLDRLLGAAPPAAPEVA